MVALVGASGGGKSSCVNLLQHFYATRTGEVLLDGRPISQYDHRYLHHKVKIRDVIVSKIDFQLSKAFARILTLFAKFLPLESAR